MILQRFYENSLKYSDYFNKGSQCLVKNPYYFLDILWFNKGFINW